LVPDQPENLSLFGYNLNDKLNDPEVFERNAYDLIHSRFVGPGIKTSRWGAYVMDMKRLLRPNGWLQMIEYKPLIQSDSGRLSNQSALRKWWDTYVSAMESAHRSPRIGQRLQSLMTEAGLRDVGGKQIQLPVGGWDSGICCPLFFHYFLRNESFSTFKIQELSIRLLIMGVTVVGLCIAPNPRSIIECLVTVQWQEPTSLLIWL
jgi:hypothetical protein